MYHLFALIKRVALLYPVSPEEGTKEMLDDLDN